MFSRRGTCSRPRQSCYIAAGAANFGRRNDKHTAADPAANALLEFLGRIAFFSAARQVYLEPARGELGFWDRLPQMRVPALFVWGEKDWLVPARFEHHVAMALPHARSVLIDDCGHVPQYEFPELTNSLIREFIEARSAAA